MRVSSLKTVSLGICAILVADGVWFFFLWGNIFLDILMWFTWITPIVSAFFVAYVVPHNKIILGFSMAPFSAVIACVFNLIHMALGKGTDFPGVQGTLFLFIAILIVNGILCIFSALCGYIFSRKQRE